MSTKFRENLKMYLRGQDQMKCCGLEGDAAANYVHGNSKIMVAKNVNVFQIALVYAY